MSKHIEIVTGGGSPFRFIPLGDLFESPNNPRKHFNPKALSELADSIGEHGVLTPLLVRPKDRISIAPSGKNATMAPLFEIAAGHRRYRAAQIAALTEVPAIVRDMTDQQFMEVLTVENLQREDVHAYEEAQGYAELLKLPGYDVGAVAGKIGRSDAYVRSRIKLLNLIPEVAEAFLSDRITFAHARLIAPLAAEKQAEGLKECFARYGKNSLLPASELRDWISSEEGEDLADAPFALDDAGLLAAAGACVTCPKSTCAEGKLFGDDSGEETCYDKKCFEAKTEAHVAQCVAKGFVQISESRNYNADAPKGMLKHTEYADIHPADPDGDEQSAADQCPHMEDAVVASGYGLGTTKKICRNPKCPVHGEEAQEAQEAVRNAERATSTSNGNSQHAERQREQQEARDKQEAEWAERRDTYNAIRADWQPNLDPTLGMLLVMEKLKHVYSTARLKVLCEERELEAQEKSDLQIAALIVWAEKASGYELGELLVDLTLEPHIERRSWDTNYDLLTIASDNLGIPEKKPVPVKKAAAKKAKKK